MNVPWDVPVDPPPPEARDWLIDELSKPQYQAAKPTLFDQIAQAIGDWLASLRLGNLEGPPAFGFGIIIVLVVAALVVAFLIFGLPRLNRRSSVAGVLFGEDDQRSAATMRADAAAAADRGDYATGIAELFRAIARGLSERGIVTVSPGTTGRGFAAAAGARFPQFDTRLFAAAVAFDEVRYLGLSGSILTYETIVTLESELRAVRAAPAVQP